MSYNVIMFVYTFQNMCSENGLAWTKVLGTEKFHSIIVLDALFCVKQAFILSYEL